MEQQRCMISIPSLPAVFNLYCLSGTYGGYGGPSEMYSLLPADRYSCNIIRVHTSKDLSLCVQELVTVIQSFQLSPENKNIPMILMGWSQGGYTVIAAIDELRRQHPSLYKRVKGMILIASRPEKTESIQSMEGIHKYIICGDQDTPRRKDGALKMVTEAADPKVFIPIVNGTHNFEIQECFNSLCQQIDSILLQEMNRFI